MRPQPRPRPDLTVAEYQFAPTNDKALRVSVANIGGAAAGASTLRLTVRKIKGAAVGRTMEIQVPAISAGQNDWVTLVADGILPKNVSLKDTTFRVNLDVGNSVSESNEKNNEKWHNLN
jgi:subtilase family serine protease